MLRKLGKIAWASATVFLAYEFITQPARSHTRGYQEGRIAGMVEMIQKIPPGTIEYTLRNREN